MSTEHVYVSKWEKLVLFTKYVFYKSALPSDTSVGRKLSWKYRNIVPLLVDLPPPTWTNLFWSSPEALQLSRPTIILNYSHDCRPVNFFYFTLCKVVLHIMPKGCWRSSGPEVKKPYMLYFSFYFLLTLCQGLVLISMR